MFNEIKLFGPNVQSRKVPDELPPPRQRLGEGGTLNVEPGTLNRLWLAFKPRVISAPDARCPCGSAFRPKRSDSRRYRLPLLRLQCSLRALLLRARGLRK